MRDVRVRGMCACCPIGRYSALRDSCVREHRDTYESTQPIFISQMDLSLYFFRTHNGTFSGSGGIDRRVAEVKGNLFFFYLILLIAFTSKLCKLALACRRQSVRLSHRYCRCIRSHFRYLSTLTFGIVAAMAVNGILVSHNNCLCPNWCVFWCFYLKWKISWLTFGFTSFFFLR